MIKLVCYDMDGTVSIKDQLIDGVNIFFDWQKENNIHYVFITNNSSKSIETYIRKMTNLGLEVDSSNFYTSTEVTINYIKKQEWKNIYVIGTKDFRNKLSKQFNVCNDNKDCDPEAVILAFDTELNYKKITKGVEYINKGLPFIATNPDLRCPIGNDEYIPDCGSMAKLFTDATGVVPKYLGKPNSTIVDDLIEKYKLKKNEVIVVGDRLYTDILCGINAGVKTAAVLTGETTLDEINQSEYKPDYVLNRVDELKDIIEELKNDN